MQASLDSSLANKRRRVPIKIIEPLPAATSTTSSSTIPVPSKPKESHVSEPFSRAVPPILSDVKTDTLEPVSSRSLKSPSLEDGKASLTTLTEQGSTDNNNNPLFKTEAPSIAPLSTNGTSKPNSFKDAKQARDSAKPSRVGGGIFRASGNNTIFSPRDIGNPTFADPPNPDTSTSPSSIGPPGKDDPKSTSYPSVPKAPNTLFDFVKSWGSLHSTEEKWQLINVGIFKSDDSSLF